jgi:NADH-quinone oxidoreductase subunit L
MGHESTQLVPVVVTHATWLWLIPLLPLIGATINAVFGWKLQGLFGEPKSMKGGRGKQLVHFIAVGFMMAAFAVAAYSFVQLKGLPAEERFLQQTLWNMFTAGRLSVDLAFSLDQLSMMMVLIITGIGTLIHIFSIGYMAEEPAYWRFFSYLNFFVFAMLLLVMGDNFAVMFFGWEGVGLASYLLIAFWYTDPAKAAAGMKAFVVNRFGDFGFIIGLMLLFWGLGGAWQARDGLVRNLDYVPSVEMNSNAGAATAAESAALAPVVDGVKVGPTMNFRELRDQVVIEATGVKEHLAGTTVWGISLLTLIGMLLFVGAMGKSAQIPLYVWLPDAMAGPTPVSALIHAATMVTAGVYMVARLNFLFVMSPSAMGWIALIGALTAIFAATIGFFQYDIKKVLAYSTVSQLGFMFIGVGTGAYWAGVYHLLTHAFFKATLFLGSGSVILGCHHEQDMRKMGGLKKHMPITRWTYLIATVAIAGFPIANGFYSKDEILWKAFTSHHLALFGTPTPWLGPVIFVIGLLAATGTSFYMYRSYYMTFTGEYRGGDGHHGDAHDAPAGTAHAAPASTSHAADHGAHAAPAAAAAHSAHAAPAAHGHDAPAAHGHDAHGHGAHAAPAAAHATPADDHGGGHHGGTPHESPWQITLVLAILAGGSVLTLFLGIPVLWQHTFAHANTPPILEHWLEPVLLSKVAFGHGTPAMEWLFQGLGVLAATVGFVAARAVYKDNKNEAALKAMIERWKGVWTLVYNKYYVDELYEVIVLRPAARVAGALSWFDGKILDGLVHAVAAVTKGFANLDGAIDKYVVDGAVNGVANAIGWAGGILRHVQTGRIQTYLYGALGGALVVVLVNFLIS